MFFLITRTGVKTNGSQRDDEYVKQNCYTQGSACSTLIMRNGWEIPKDYPW